MEPIESDLREDLFPVLFEEKEVDDDLQALLGHGVNHGSIITPET